MHPRSSLCVGLLVAGLASACSSAGAITSLDDLTAHVDPSGALESLPQHRVLSLSGMVPSGEPGRVFRFHNDRSPFTAFGISQRRYDVPHEGCFQNWCEALGDGDSETTCEANHGAHINQSHLAVGDLCSKKEHADCGHVTPTISGRTVALSQDHERESYYLKRTIPFGDDLADEAALKELLKIRDKLIDVRVAASKVIRLRLEAAARRGSIVTTADQEASTSANADADAAQSAFETVWGEAAKMIRRPGLMIIRYNTKEETSLGAKIGSILGFNSESSEENGGFAILGHIELATLYLGDDFDAWAQPPGVDWSLFGARFPFVLGWWDWDVDLFGLPLGLPYPGQLGRDHVQVITSRLAAKYMLYASDRITERKIEANLEASVEQLQNLGDTLTEVDEVAIDAVLGAVESLGTVGVLGEMRQEAVPVCQWEELENPALQDIYVVMTEYDDLQRFASSKPRLHLTRWW